MPEPRLDREEAVHYGTQQRAHASHGARQEPMLDARGPADAAPASRESSGVPDFEFDFGFGTSEVAARSETSRPEPQATSAASVPAHRPEMETGDPIADLIADAEAEQFEADEPPEESAREAEQGRAPDYSEWFKADDSRKAGQQGPDNRDPLSDIEALIGEAARVSTSAAAGGADIVSSRRVRSSFLDGDEDYAAGDEATGGQAGRPAGSDTEAALSPSEQAILAAEAAGAARAPMSDQGEPVFDGAHQAHVADSNHSIPVSEAPPDLVAGTTVGVHGSERERDDGHDGRDEASTRKPRRNGIVLPALLGTVILAGMGGIYFAFFAGPGDPADVPVLAADGEPLKMEVEREETATTASQSVVFNELDGGSSEGVAEALVSRDQTGGATGDAVSTIITPEEGDVGLANRPVRTVTVRPDGTIVSGDETVAGGNVLPVDRPNVPDVPSSSFTEDPIGEAIAAAMADTGGMPPEGPSAGQSDTQPAGSETASALTASPSDNGSAPNPAPRPNGLETAAADTGAAGQAAQAETAPAQEVAAVDTGAASGGQPVGAWVQLSSQRSEEAAQAGIPTLQSQFGSLFNGAELEVNRVDLGDRGIYYRVRLPQPSMAEANSVCTAIQQQGGDCFVLNN